VELYQFAVEARLPKPESLRRNESLHVRLLQRQDRRKKKNKEIKTLIIVYNHSKNETSFFST